MGQVPWPYYRCFYVWNVLQPKYGSNVTGSHLENRLQDNSRCGKSAFLIHMSDSRHQIAPRRPEKIHGAWENTCICRNTLHLYFQEDLQVQWTTFWKA